MKAEINYFIRKMKEGDMRRMAEKEQKDCQGRGKRQEQEKIQEQEVQQEKMIQQKQNIQGGTDGMDYGEIHISVRRLVEFILRHGDIDNRYQASPDNAMQEGGRIHRMIQRRMGAEYQAEVSLKYTMPGEQYLLIVEGRADGVIHHNGRVIIDEIKGTYGDLARMREPKSLHLAQAKCYAYMYGVRESIAEIGVRMTYCNMYSEELRYFYEDYSFSELEEWFQGLAAAYRKWADYAWNWRKIRQESIEGLAFPFPYREGQKELVANVYRTIYHKKKLFLEAPTGVGKTISTIYPAIQAMGRDMGEKIFYLTAKTITRTVAEDTLNLLRNKGLRVKSVILTAKEKICFMEDTDCNPENCPYARGHYDRVNEAVFDILTTQESFCREKIEAYAKKHQVCPFEMCLDMSLFADVIICDYNYLFDPHIYLKRFFGESSAGEGKREGSKREEAKKDEIMNKILVGKGAPGSYIFLIDEAHNLLERGREMYSALLWKEQFVELSEEIEQTLMSDMEQENTYRKKQDVSGQYMFRLEEKKTVELTYMSEKIQVSDFFEQSGDDIREDGMPEQGSHLWNVGEETENINIKETGMGGIRKSNAKYHRGKSVLVKQGYGEKMLYHLRKCNQELLLLKRECSQYRIIENLEAFMQNLLRFQTVLDDYLSEAEEVELSVRELLLNFYFEVNHFLSIYDLLDDNYVMYTQICQDGSFFVKLLCVNPGENLKNCMMRARSTILFSATFLPIQYYKKLLGGDKEDYEVYAKSVFHPAKRALLIASDVTSKYTRRSQSEYYNIARYIEEIVRNRHGNYMVFCPSYAFLRIIYDLYAEHFGHEDRECILQNESMSEADREEFLEKFQANCKDSGNGIGQTKAAKESGLKNMGEDKVLIGFCVLGGIFSEGIDLKNDSLIGVIIIGTGLPQVCDEREILKAYFDANGEDGFDYSYRYPGMNKVLQAAGRVIRTVEDVGIIALLDERFLQYSYRRLFPLEWQQFDAVTVNNVAKRVERFWDEWL